MITSEQLKLFHAVQKLRNHCIDQSIRFNDLFKAECPNGHLTEEASQHTRDLFHARNQYVLFAQKIGMLISELTDIGGGADKHALWLEAWGQFTFNHAYLLEQLADIMKGLVYVKESNPQLMMRLDLGRRMIKITEEYIHVLAIIAATP